MLYLVTPTYHNMKTLTMSAQTMNASMKMDGWITCDFTSFSTVFQSYQDDKTLIMKSCVCNGTPFTIEKISPRAGMEVSPLDQQATA